MGLITCPDCNKQISDSAVNCIHCGRPMRKSREAILVEIQNLTMEHDRLWAILDDNSVEDGYYITEIQNELKSVNEKLAELQALLR